MVKVLSLGGSVVAPKEPDAPFLSAFAALVRRRLEADAGLKFILVVGGGGPARAYQEACRAVFPGAQDAELDWIGIMATRLNARLVKAAFGELCPAEVVVDPLAVEVFPGRIMVAAGWKPGFSTDYDAVVLAERFGADSVYNLSNVAKVFSADPKADPDAKPLDRMSWKDFRAMVGDAWTPGRNLPFDPVAAKRASEIGVSVVCAAGRDLPNLEAILDGRPFVGTVIGP
jgi:uridylate kinase